MISRCSSSSFAVSTVVFVSSGPGFQTTKTMRGVTHGPQQEIDTNPALLKTTVGKIWSHKKFQKHNVIWSFNNEFRPCVTPYFHPEISSEHDGCLRSNSRPHSLERFGGFLKWWETSPQIIHLFIGVSIINHPFFGGFPTILGNSHFNLSSMTQHDENTSYPTDVTP